MLPFANAQIETNTIMIGGNSGLGINDKSFGLSLNPRVGIFLAPDFVIGADVNSTTSWMVDNNTTDFSFSYDLGVFLRYYLSPGKNWRPFLHAELDNIPTIWRFDGAAGAGIAYFFSPRVSVETQLLIRGIDLFDGPDISISGLNVGVHVFFPPKAQK